MGLDAVELVMAFEEKFALTIPDEEAEKMITPRHVIDYIYAQVQHSNAKACLSQHAFYRLRKALQSELGLQRAAIRPATLLASIVPLSDRGRAWERAGNALELGVWPALSRSRETVLAIATGSAAVGAAVYAASPPFAFAFAGASAVATAVLLTRATQHLRLHFVTPTTVGQLAELMVARDAANPKPEGEVGWSREQVRAVVRAIIIDHLNVEPTFSDDASFVDDLGVA